MKAVTATHANRYFSSLLREVASGVVITILSRGKAVATIAPANTGSSERAQARLLLLKRLHQQQHIGARNQS